MNNKGLSLIEIVVAGAAGAILLMTFGKGLVAQSKVQNTLDLKAELHDARQMLKMRTSCENTLPANCGNGQFVTLKDSRNDIIVASGNALGAKYGSISVRAQCTGSGVQVEYAKGNSPWAHLFQVNDALCSVEKRTSALSLVAASYNYIAASNVGNSSQTVTLRFETTGYTIAAGGFKQDITGSSSQGGPVASQGVTCNQAGTICTLTKVLLPGRTMRAGVRATCVGCADYRAMVTLLNSSTDLGLIGKVIVAESGGQITANSLSWFDYDYTANQFMDAAVSTVFNGGQLF